jgi:L-threonylcarbamoyladenylate synthase
MTREPILVPANRESITRAANLLREGKLVAFPTETVYGLGADATSDHAVAALYAAKGRPHFNPLIIHVAENKALDPLIEWTETARRLADQFWPGPLTLVLPRRRDAKVSLLASAGMDTLAVRIPSHPIAQLLLKEVGIPIAAPSANASGKLSPTAPVHVAASLGTKVDLILAAGESNIGLESTVLNLTSPTPTILRPGGITREQLEWLLGTVGSFSGTANQTPMAPGLQASHYAPDLPLRLNANGATEDEALLTFGPDRLIKGGAVRLSLSPRGDLQEAASNLFAMLRQVDTPNFQRIAVTSIPAVGLGVAINDRLERAAVRVPY